MVYLRQSSAPAPIVGTLITPPITNLSFSCLPGRILRQELWIPASIKMNLGSVLCEGDAANGVHVLARQAIQWNPYAPL